MHIIEKPLHQLQPYEKNPRKNDGAVQAVANSIREFGFKVPLVIDKNYVIIAGHTRYKAALQLGMETVPCVIADDLTEEQIKAFRIADNKTGELAEWDFALLNEELSDISDIDMSEFGFHVQDTFADIDETDLVNDGKRKILSIDGEKLEMTEEECQELLDLANQYVNESGVSYGFVRWLLHEHTNHIN